jgi:putative glutamine amidotransferase
VRPRIAITCRYQLRTIQDNVQVPDISVDARFADLILDAGGIPAFIPPTEDAAALHEFLASADAVILSGGPDITPGRYGCPPHPATTCMHPRRECSDFHVIEYAEQHELPLLAICLGIQEWNVSRGGTLHQHVPDLHGQPNIAHRDGQLFAFHTVRLAPGSLIESIVQTNPLPVNSSHHQCVNQLGRNLIATAWAEDGIVEAIQDPRRRFAQGIQWHPEDMPDDPIQRKIFQALVAAAQK